MTTSVGSVATGFAFGAPYEWRRIGIPGTRGGRTRLEARSSLVTIVAKGISCFGSRRRSGSYIKNVTSAGIPSSATTTSTPATFRRCTAQSSSGPYMSCKGSVVNQAHSITGVQPAHPRGAGRPARAMRVSPQAPEFAAKSTSAVLTVPAVRPGALWFCQYRLVWAMTLSGGGAPNEDRSSVVWASPTSVAS